MDILVNNAGYLETNKPIGEAGVDEWWYGWEVNIKGLFLVTHALLPFVLKSKEKTVVNVSSNGAHWMVPGVSILPSILVRIRTELIVDCRVF